MTEFEPLADDDDDARWRNDIDQIWSAKVTGRHTVTLPAELCRVLGIKVGDRVEFHLRHGVVTMTKPGGPPPLEALGILADYRYESMDAMIREIRDGRGTWTAEDEADYQRNRRSEPGATSGD
jgi:bifunctional DNA-binding transcriptional regulator/antitoxin component of YhaV-PrlF toxin-antitoxin module